MDKYQEALYFLINKETKLEEAQKNLESGELLQRILDNVRKPYMNDKGGCSCKGCGHDLFLSDTHCFCGLELDWSNNK